MRVAGVAVLRIWLAALLSALVMAGCATESSTVARTSPVSMDQALEDHIQLGLGYIGQGNRESARHHLSKAMEINANSAGAHNGMALLYEMEQENALAERHYRRAIALDRNYTRARNNYGAFLYQQQRVDEAYRQFQVVVRDTAYAQRPQAFISLGVTASQLGHEKEAVEAWNRAIALNPRLSTPYLELADYQFREGDYPEARRYLAAYDSLTRPTARSLWLGLRLEHRFGNRDGVASKALALSKLFPYSQEYLEYQEWLENEQNQ
ncbi:MAG: type IV pilus biogenesis/stability protein PilW [Bacteroidales bacterium]|nr:type IV pilus biogenesis/stability protein PilW [Bacteroidales bacterium]